MEGTLIVITPIDSKSKSAVFRALQITGLFLLVVAVMLSKELYPLLGEQDPLIWQAGVLLALEHLELLLNCGMLAASMMVVVYPSYFTRSAIFVGALAFFSQNIVRLTRDHLIGGVDPILGLSAPAVFSTVLLVALVIYENDKEEKARGDRRFSSH